MDNLTQLLFTGFGAAVIAAILFGTREIFNKYLTKTNKVSLLAVLIGQFIFATFFILILSLVNNQFSTNPLAVLFAFMGSIILSFWMLMQAYSDIMVNYAIAIKRAGLLIPILLGPIFFKEKNLIKRLPGILLMLGGAIIIIIFG